VSGANENSEGPNSQGPIWEVFSQEKPGGPHVHVGSVHAADAELALQAARDVYARRGSPCNLWVVPFGAITASQPEDAGSFFDPADDKIYRHPSFYNVPRTVKGV
jgi:ring-1,2-phenylacetyl-CoA epoxidase subunit PaaB